MCFRVLCCLCHGSIHTLGNIAGTSMKVRCTLLFARQMNCDDWRPCSSLVILVFSVALRWMAWPGCMYKGNPPKQGGCLQLTYRIWSLACPKPLALPRCWEKVVASTEIHASNSANSLYVDHHVLVFVVVSWPCLIH